MTLDANARLHMRMYMHLSFLPRQLFERWIMQTSLQTRPQNVFAVSPVLNLAPNHVFHRHASHHCLITA